MGDRHDMNVEQILFYLRQNGIVLTPNGDRIKYKGPCGAMTPELAEEIKAHRAEILGALYRETFLPDSCPIMTNRYSRGVTHHCRFAEKILRELIADRVLPLDTGCPLIHACSLVCLISDREKNPVIQKKSKNAC